VACDSGGREGVTKHAYAAWRKLRDAGDGWHRRFILVKGDSYRKAPLVRTAWPDSSQKDKFATARGDVPVVMLNSNSVKDIVYLMMQRRVAKEAEQQTGGGMLRYPDWLENWFYIQLTSEIRSEKGWENTRKRRNESFDLSYYAIGIAYRPQEMGFPTFTSAWTAWT
jgi:phage terminase large subunit GpA-like protein